MSGFAGLAPCVHCGFCLQACPTFVVTGDEADSPRGRIVLMQALDRGDIAADDPALALHLDRCLGCRACEPACPSGVAYGGALEAARERILERRPVTWPARLLLTIMARPGLRRAVFALARLLRPVARWFAGPGRLGMAWGMLEGTRRWQGGQARQGRQGDAHPNNALSATPAPSAAPAAVFTGCIQRELFPHVNAAAERTLRAGGYGVEVVAGQQCCGALHAHAGLLEEARELARRNVLAFAEAPDTLVAVTAAGCGAMLRSYGELLADDPLAAEAGRFTERVRDVTELLAGAPAPPPATLTMRAVYDPPCHLAHAQGVRDEPLRVLTAIGNLDLVPHEEADMCCGSAGIYSLLQPALSGAVLRRKTDAILAARPDVVITGNPGCVMQISAGLRAAGRPLPVLHPVEVLDRAYRDGGTSG